jgi:hypothetical protein
MWIARPCTGFFGRRKMIKKTSTNLKHSNLPSYFANSIMLDIRYI